jgi:uncharacterized damage-inducible protein DinB
MFTWKNYFLIQADYQHWANEILFNSLDLLTQDAIDSNQGLFFQSIHHTADHILMVNRTWLARLRGEAFSVNYRQIQYPDWRELKKAMRQETRKLQKWLDEQPEEFFDGQVTFVGGDGRERTLWVRDALTHLFTHFAHHRGQVSAVATRLGAPCPEMDFIYYRREMERLLAEVKNGQAGPAAAG